MKICKEEKLLLEKQATEMGYELLFREIIDQSGLYS